MSGKYFSRISTLGEKISHELLGHGMYSRSGGSSTTGHNENAISMSNLFLKVAYSKHGLMRDGTQHKGGTLSKSESNQIPSYLQYVSPVSSIPQNTLNQLINLKIK